MELRSGLIHNELELKTYLLFILKNCPEPLSLNSLTGLTMDRVKNYFEFIQALSELTSAGLVLEEGADRCFHITAQGRQTLEAVVDSLPYSTRLHTLQDISVLLAKMERSAYVGAATTENADGSAVTLTLKADHGQFFSLELLLDDNKKALAIERNFSVHAEKIYSEILDVLTKKRTLLDTEEK